MDDKYETIAVGKKCTVILNNFIKLVFAGNSKEATGQLLRLKNIGDCFAVQVERLLFEQVTFESYFMTKEEASKRYISECVHGIIKLEEEQVSVYSVLERNVVLMSHFKQNLESAVEKFLHIESEVKMLSRDQKHRSMPLPATYNNVDSKEDLHHASLHQPGSTWRVAVKNRKQEHDAAESKVAFLQKDIEGRKAQIQKMKERLGALKVEKHAYQRRLSAIRDKITFLEQAVELWSLTELVSDENKNLEELSSSIFKKATEKSRSIVCGPTRQMAHTFIEAWDSELLRAERGFSHILNFTFTCGKCGRVSSSIPHVKGRSLHCVTCHNMWKSLPRLTRLLDADINIVRNIKKMEDEVIVLGKQCMETLTSVIKLTSLGNLEEATRKLLAMKDNGVAFAEKLQEIVSKQERLKTFFVKAEVNSKRDIADCTHQLLELMESHASMLSDLERNIVLSFHFKSKLDLSLDELSMVSQATKIITKEGTLRIKGNKDILPHISSEEDVKDEIYKKETKISSVVEHNRRQCHAAEVVLDAIRKKLKENRREIAELEDKLGELQRRKDGAHRKALQMKQSIDFLDNALDFWLLMQLLSEEDDNNIEVTKTLSSKAAEKIVISSGSRATRRLASTFLEALESEIVQAEKGYSHVLSCGFHCEGCNTINNKTPHVSGARLLCTDCYESHQSLT